MFKTLEPVEPETARENTTPTASPTSAQWRVLSDRRQHCRPLSRDLEDDDRGLIIGCELDADVGRAVGDIETCFTVPCN